jgi:hypothetical protein
MHSAFIDKRPHRAPLVHPDSDTVERSRSDDISSRPKSNAISRNRPCRRDDHDRDSTVGKDSESTHDKVRYPRRAKAVFF